MTHFSLTEDHAKILDEMIQSMADKNHNDSSDFAFDESRFVLDKKEKEKRDLSHEELLGIIAVAQIYMKDNVLNPFIGELSDLHLTKNAVAFRAFGGFKKVYEIENKKDSYEKQLKDSTLYTMWLAIVIGVISAGAAIQTCRLTNQQNKAQSQQKSKDSLTCKQHNKLIEKDDTHAVKEKTTTLSNGVTDSSKVDTPALKQNLVDNKNGNK